MDEVAKRRDVKDARQLRLAQAEQLLAEFSSEVGRPARSIEELENWSRRRKARHSN